jgi:MFS family permease
VNAARGDARQNLDLEPSDRDRAALEAGFADARARGEFIRLGLAGFLASFMYSHGALLAVIFDREGFDLHQIGLLLSLYAAPVIFSSLVSGAVAARLGVLPTCRLSVILMIAGFFSLRYTGADFWPALASRFVQGVGQGLFLGSFVTYAQSRLSPRRFVYLLGLFSSMLPLAQAFGPPFGAFILNAYGAKTVFLEAAIPACIGLALTFGLRPLPRPAPARGLDFSAAWRRDRFAPLAAAFVNGTMVGFTGAYLAAALDAKALPIGAFFLASTTAMLASRFLAMRRLEAADRRILIGCGFLLEGLSFILVALAGRSWLVVIAGMLFGMGYSVVYPVLSAWMSEGVDPSARAGPQALFNTIFSAGILLTPYPEAMIIAVAGYAGAALVLAAFGITAAAVILGWALRRPAH